MKNYTFETKSVAASFAALFLVLAAPAIAQPGPRGGAPGIVAPLQPLTAAETQTLRFMREEEKLARDVYEKLNQKWNLPVFQNISGSEQTHFDAIGILLVRYGVADPAQNNPAGVYSDAGLNALYNQLLAKGMLSAQEALNVGSAIEKKDIADLEAAIKDATQADVKRVYTNLMNASYNHLEAFETLCTLTTTP